jgi:hypothetical protein
MRRKHFWSGIAFVLLVSGGISVAHSKPTRSHERAANSVRTPILVELFTSEGCSSCPPADAFLARLEAQQPIAGAEVIAIEEHVDYWDDLGWRDPFSSGDWTERQRRYADVLGSGNVYTPQMIVGGSAQFVGSREQSGRVAIEQAAKRSAIALSLTSEAVPGKRAAEITIKVEKADAEQGGDSELWLAITETGLQSAVTRGENAGKDLRHASVLRKLQKLGAVKPGAPGTFTTKVSFDASWKRENLHAVAFVQERRKLHILGAAQIPLA